MAGYGRAASLGKAGRAMTHLIPVTLERTLADLTRALDAMREAGFTTTTPTPPTVDASGPHVPATGLPEEFS